MAEQKEPGVQQGTSVKMQELTDENFQTLWENLQSDENYEGLADYIMYQNGSLRDNLTTLRNSLAANLDTLDTLMLDVCHPPPGCKP